MNERTQRKKNFRNKYYQVGIADIKRCCSIFVTQKSFEYKSKISRIGIYINLYAVMLADIQ